MEEDVEGEAKGEDEERVPGQEQEEGVQHSGTRGFIWNSQVSRGIRRILFIFGNCRRSQKKVLMSNKNETMILSEAATILSCTVKKANGNLKLSEQSSSVHPCSVR